mgnify:FL=1
MTTTQIALCMSLGSLLSSIVWIYIINYLTHRWSQIQYEHGERRYDEGYAMGMKDKAVKPVAK